MNAFLKSIACAAVLSLAACASDETRPADDSATTGDAGASTSTTPMDTSTGADVTSAPMASMPNVRVIYFAFDSSDSGPIPSARRPVVVAPLLRDVRHGIARRLSVAHRDPLVYRVVDQ